MHEPYYTPSKVSAAKQIDQLTRQLLRDKVAKLEEHSRTRFYAIWRHPYPDGDPIEQMNARQLKDSIELVDRTLEVAEPLSNGV